MPPALKAAPGVDALTHAIEGHITRAAWALTDALLLSKLLRLLLAEAARGAAAGAVREAGGGDGAGQIRCRDGGFQMWASWCMGWRIRWAFLQHAAWRRECYSASACDMRFSRRVYQREIAYIARDSEGRRIESEEARNAAVEAVFTLNRDGNSAARCVMSAFEKRISRRWRRRRLRMMSVRRQSA